MKTKITLKCKPLLLLCMTLAASSTKADVVTDWNQITLTTQLAIPGAQRRPNGARALAMVHVAMFDSINAIDRHYRPYAITPLANPHASSQAAAVAAAHGVLINLYPSRQAELDSAYALSLASIPENNSRAEGVSIGESVAGIILLLRSNDGSDTAQSYTVPAAPGIYVPDPAAFFVAWGSLRPFALKAGSQFRAEGPPALQSEQYLADYNEVKAIGALGSTTRTPDQTEAALFWMENAQLTWNNIARLAALSSDHDLLQNARLFALLNLALVDTTIVTMDTKYTYNFWRPREAIRGGDVDGNPNTIADPLWTSLAYIGTHPEYTSNHSACGAAAAMILKHFFPAHDIDFRLTTTTAPGGIFRSYCNFIDAAHENMNSRIWLGVHFRTSCRNGFKQGKEVGNYVFAHYLLPLKNHSGQQHDDECGD